MNVLELILTRILEDQRLDDAQVLMARACRGVADVDAHHDAPKRSARPDSARAGRSLRRPVHRTLRCIAGAAVGPPIRLHGRRRPRAGEPVEGLLQQIDAAVIDEARRRPRAPIQASRESSVVMPFDTAETLARAAHSMGRVHADANDLPGAPGSGAGGRPRAEPERSGARRSTAPGSSCNRHKLRDRTEPGLTFEQLRHFLSRVRRDPDLKRQVQEAITADEVARLAQELGYSVSGSDILRFSGQSADGVKVTRIDHPGEYPGRYY